MKSMIYLENATKLYGSVIGINDVSADLGPGAYGLLGPNGSGKTTLLHLLTGQISLTLGDVKLFGANPQRDNKVLDRVGLCTASDLAYTNVTAFQWIRYMAEVQGIPTSQSIQRTEETLRWVGLGDAMHRSIGGYSRGMKQRCKLAQSIIHEPELLLLDEPFAGLDPIARHDITQFLRQWVEQGRSLILASHILHEVEAISNTFLLLCGGRLLAAGSPEEVHRLLTNIPKEISVRCDQPRVLAERLLREPSVKSIHFEDAWVRLASTAPLDLFQRLPVWAEESGLTIHEVRSDEESLQGVFSMLMKIHRGEIG